MITKFQILPFVICIFMGVTVISLGLGAAFPSINLIAKPIVCAEGKMEMRSKVYRPYPGKTVSSQTWYCMQPSGVESRLNTFLIVLSSGSFYGIIIFLFVRKPWRRRN